MSLSGGCGTTFDAENAPSCDVEVVAVVVGFGPHREHHGIRGAGRRGERGRQAEDLEGVVL